MRFDVEVQRQKLTEHPIHKSRLQLQAPRSRSMIMEVVGSSNRSRCEAPRAALCASSSAARALSSAFVLLDKHYSCCRILSSSSALKRRDSPLKRSLLLEWAWTHPPSASLKRQEAAQSRWSRRHVRHVGRRQWRKKEEARTGSSTRKEGSNETTSNERHKHELFHFKAASQEFFKLYKGMVWLVSQTKFCKTAAKTSRFLTIQKSQMKPAMCSMHKCEFKY